MAIKNGDQFVTLLGADGKAIPFKLTPATKSGQQFIPVQTADGKIVPMAVKPCTKTGEQGFPVTSADGKVMLMKGAGGLGKFLIATRNITVTGGRPIGGAARYDEEGDEWDSFFVDRPTTGVISGLGFCQRIVKYNGTIYALNSGLGTYYSAWPVTQADRRYFVKRSLSYPWWVKASTLADVGWSTSAFYADMIEYSGKLYLCGFGHSSVGASDRVMEWDGSNFASTGFGNFTVITRACVWNNKLVVCGSFTNAAGVGANYIAYYDGTWHAFANQPNGNVLSVCEFNGDLYIGGSFTTIGGAAMARFAKFDGANWSLVGGGISIGVGSPSIYSLASTGAGVTFSGNFDHIDAAGLNIPCKSLGRWDGAAYQALITTITPIAPTQMELSVVDDEVWVGHDLADSSRNPLVFDGFTSDKCLFIVNASGGIRKWGHGGCSYSVRVHRTDTDELYFTIASTSPSDVSGQIGDILPLRGVGIVTYDADTDEWTAITTTRPQPGNNGYFACAFQLRNNEGGLDLYGVYDGSINVGGVTKANPILRYNVTEDKWEYASVNYPRFDDTPFGYYDVQRNMELDDPLTTIVFAANCHNDATHVSFLAEFDGQSFSDFHGWNTARSGIQCSCLEWDPGTEQWFAATDNTLGAAFQNNYCFISWWNGSTWTWMPWLVISGIAGKDQYQYSAAYYDSTPAVQRDHWIRPGSSVRVIGGKIYAAQYGNDFMYRPGDIFVSETADPAGTVWQQVFFTFAADPPSDHGYRVGGDSARRTFTKVGERGLLIELSASKDASNSAYIAFWDLMRNGSDMSVTQPIMCTSERNIAPFILRAAAFDEMPVVNTIKVGSGGDTVQHYVEHPYMTWESPRVHYPAIDYYSPAKHIWFNQDDITMDGYPAPFTEQHVGPLFLPAVKALSTIFRFHED